jgi:transposase
LRLLLPHLADVQVEWVSTQSNDLRIEARTRDSTSVACPACGSVSVRRHSGYRRRLADAAIGGQAVEIVLEVRRLFCDSAACPRVTFVEQIDGLTERCCDGC